MPSSIRQNRPGRRWVGFVLFVVLAGWAGWFIFGRVTVHEVTTKARLEVQSAAHTVAAPVSGVVTETHMVIGRDIKVGDVLAVLDARAERLALEQKRTSHSGIIKRIAGLRAQIDAEEVGLESQKKSRVLLLQEAEAAINQARIQAKLDRSQLEQHERLIANKIISREEYDKCKAAVQTSETQIHKLTVNAAYLHQDSLSKECDRHVLLAKLKSEVITLESEAANEEAAMASLSHVIELRTIRASVAGKIGDVAAEVQVGSVVRAADKLATIIPDGAPRVVALFPAAAIGRIRPGQPARLRLDGFPWTQYGTLAATVVQVGNEVGDGGLIRVELALADNPSSLIPLGHGLPGTAEVAVDTVSPAVLVLRGAGLGVASPTALAE